MFAAINASLNKYFDSRVNPKNFTPKEPPQESSKECPLKIFQALNFQNTTSRSDTLPPKKYETFDEWLTKAVEISDRGAKESIENFEKFEKEHLRISAEVNELLEQIKRDRQ